MLCEFGEKTDAQQKSEKTGDQYARSELRIDQHG